MDRSSGFRLYFKLPNWDRDLLIGEMGRQRTSPGRQRSGNRRPFRKQTNVQRLGRAIRKYVHVETQEGKPWRYAMLQFFRCIKLQLMVCTGHNAVGWMYCADCAGHIHTYDVHTLCFTASLQCIPQTLCVVIYMHTHLGSPQSALTCPGPVMC